MAQVAPPTPANDAGETGTSTDYDDLAYRQAPHNLEAEQALLGAMLVNNEAVNRVMAFLEPEHFFESVHGRIYEAMVKLVNEGRTADPIKLKPYFEGDEGLVEVGGAQYLARLAASATTIINAEDYGRTVYDLALRRDLIRIGEEMVIDAYESPVDDLATEQIERAEQHLFNLADQGKYEGGFVNFQTSLTAAVENIEKAYKDPHKLSGATTGLETLNRNVGGLHRSDLIVLAGRPGMGKTALATNIAYNTARRYLDDLEAGEDMAETKGAVVGFFSLEMSSDQLAARILSERAGIPTQELRRGQLNATKFNELVRASRELENLPLFIDDTPALSIAGLRTRARRLKRRHGLGLVVVDYIQLVHGLGKGAAAENRVLEISEITRGLKNLAKELDIPVLALSQLSRQVESRENKRPILSDLRESGTIEQDADIVLFVYREEYYKEKAKPPDSDADRMAQWQQDMDAVHNKAEVIVGKNRHGPTSVLELHFASETTRFTDLAREGFEPEQF